MKTNTLIFLILISFLFSCKKEEVPKDVLEKHGKGIPIKSPEEIGLNENAVFLEEKSKIEILSVDSINYEQPVYEIIIENPPEDLHTGSIIVDTSGMGALWVVTGEGSSLKSSGGKGNVVKVIQGTIDLLYTWATLYISLFENNAKKQSAYPYKLESGKFISVSGENVFEKDLYLRDSECQVFGKEMTFNKNEEELILNLDGVKLFESEGISFEISEGYINYKPAIDLYMNFVKDKRIISTINPKNPLNVGRIINFKSAIYSDLELDLKFNLNIKKSPKKNFSAKIA